MPKALFPGSRRYCPVLTLFLLLLPSRLFLNLEGKVKAEHLRLSIPQLLLPTTMTNDLSWRWLPFSAKGSFSGQAWGHANLQGGSIWEAVWQHFHLLNNASRFSSSFDLPSYGPLARSTIMSNKFPLGCKILMQSENRILPHHICATIVPVNISCLEATSVEFKTQRCKRPEENALLCSNFQCCDVYQQEIFWFCSSTAEGGGAVSELII